MKFKKKIISALLVAVMSINVVTPIFASTYVDQLREDQMVANGIKYSKIQQLTSDGFININLLTLDLNDPNVTLDILRNRSTFGVQQTLTNLVGDTNTTNVVGAVNGSFFHTDTKPTDILGYEYEDGEFTFMKETYNKAKLEENSMIVSNNNEVSFGYLQANTVLHNSRGESVRLTTLNGSRDLIHLTLITDTMMKDTTRVESLGNVYKFVIEDNVVTKIVEPKVVTTVPPNGYVLTVNYNAGAEMKRKFPVGEKVTVQLSTNMDSILADTKMLFSGAGTLLRNGIYQTDGLSVGPNARHPRTCVGASKDGKTLFIMAVDGRGASIGMTNKESANFLLSLGAYNAINLDGGGSTTFAVREEGTTQAKVVNTPSDGSQRQVINGLGVKTSPTGALARLNVVPVDTKVLSGQSAAFKITGLDENGNPVTIDTTKVKLTEDVDTQNVSTNGALILKGAGKKVITADLNGIVGQTEVEVYADNITYEIEPISVPLNGKQNIVMTATTPEGYKLPISESWYSFITNGNFKVENGVLVGQNTASQGTITTTINGTTVVGKVSVGGSGIYVPLSSFENVKITGKAYPNGNEGGTGVYKEKPINGQYAIKTSFNFKASGKAQAVYSILSNVKISDSRAEKLSVNYFGQNKKNSVKAQITDARGNEKIVVFTDSVDFNGYKRLEATIPDNLVYPISVDRLYVASTGKTAISGVGYFDYLTYSIGDAFKASINDIDVSTDNLLNKSNVQTLFTVNRKTDNSINSAFTTQILNNTKIIRVSADKGSIVLTNASYYNKLKQELYTASQKNIVIVTQQSIDDSTFSIPQEGTMLKNMIEKYASTYDKNIYFVNNHANTNDTNYQNKIRNIDLFNKNLAFSLNQDGNLMYKSIN